jgi:hypothetical protein
MQDRSFWDVANSSARFDGFHDVAYAEAEQEVVARTELDLGVYTERTADVAMWFRHPNNVINVDRHRDDRHWLVA